MVVVVVVVVTGEAKGSRYGRACVVSRSRLGRSALQLLVDPPSEKEGQDTAACKVELGREGEATGDGGAMRANRLGVNGTEIRMT